MNKQIVFLLLAFFLLALIFGIRFCIAESSSWLSNWVAYFFIVPMLLFFSAALLGEKLNCTYLIAYTVGIIISILLVKGNWADNYVLQKLVASISGAIISFIIYTVWLQNKKYC